MSTAHYVSHSWRWPIIGTLVAIAATAVLDAVGLSGINALPLIPLFFLLWYLQRMSRTEIGLTWGRGRDYALAVIYPALVLVLVGLVAWLSGAAKFAATDWAKTLPNLVFLTLTNGLGALVTEEGIFRGWLWASLRRAGVTEGGVLVWTSVAFAAWHVSTALLPTEFHPSRPGAHLHPECGRDRLHLGAHAAAVRLDRGDVRQPWPLERLGLHVVWCRHHARSSGNPQHGCVRPGGRPDRVGTQPGFCGRLVLKVQPRPCHQGGGNDAVNNAAIRN
jgi:membrane protease YdiL (CAAX protease family)